VVLQRWDRRKEVPRQKPANDAAFKLSISTIQRKDRTSCPYLCLGHETRVQELKIGIGVDRDDLGFWVGRVVRMVPFELCGK